MFLQLEKDLADFEKEYRKYGQGELKDEYRSKQNVRDFAEKTAAWVAATLLLKHLKKVNKNADSFGSL